MMKHEHTIFDKILAIPKQGLGLNNDSLYTLAILFQGHPMEPSH